MPSLTSRILGKSSSHKNSSVNSTNTTGSATDIEDIDEVDDQGQNILMGIISQLRPGCDLSRITLPTFILERKSMLERITNQLQQPDILLSAHATKDPIERFLLVVKWYMSCWHIAPKAVKKPLNPILGEYFTCYWDLPDGQQAYYLAEQTSHHPPKSSYFYIIPESNIRVDGIMAPKSRFLGNSTAAMMEGLTKLTFLDIVDENGASEYYTLSQPNMYARGILFGKLKFELGDHLVIKCPHTGLVADIEFKVKGLISGTYNAIEGQIKNADGDLLYTLSGKWNEQMDIKNVETGEKSVFFDCANANPLPPKVRPLEDQGEYESRKLWKEVTDALANRDHETATDSKFAVEEDQRNAAKKREEEGVEFQPKLFRRLSINEGISNGNDKLEYLIYKDHILNSDYSKHDIAELKKHIFEMAPILPGQNFAPEFEIPAYKKSSE